MKREYYLHILTLALLLLPSCFYTDTAMYEVEPIAGDPPLLSVRTNLDTLYNPQVNDSLEVIYELEITGGEFYYMYADVGNSTVFESDSSYGLFWINPSMADSSGIDTLLMEFIYSTNSNSFADKVGYEARVDTLKFAIDFNPEEAR